LHPEVRTTTLYLGFCVCFVILSISVEGYFFAVYSATLYLWTYVEAALHASRSRQSAAQTRLMTKGSQDGQVSADDIRIAVFFLFFVQLAFFGTGK
jgi:GPI ethanolamine phosphate transferase 1